ncbi:hypothetical protein DACRYDRAFT_102968 [Dacryopinax primogenitus]|uniref:Uncharacterized protein n=1 Tax=Dacryopinax primogenitus (strain DJM 731) TaxID=1858805 RepID=M5G6Y2_DACPD|nr:uncharacterized protein DACRYDRAFT_102968 [Dacryopinax primogenitus]EJU06011.1 hypothetical protein DACRYDRAFT_102968 [Dacryopinax primogenitus]
MARRTFATTSSIMPPLGHDSRPPPPTWPGNAQPVNAPSPPHDWHTIFADVPHVTNQVETVSRTVRALLASQGLQLEDMQRYLTVTFNPEGAKRETGTSAPPAAATSSLVPYRGLNIRPQHNEVPSPMGDRRRPQDRYTGNIPMSVRQSALVEKLWSIFGIPLNAASAQSSSAQPENPPAFPAYLLPQPAPQLPASASATAAEPEAELPNLDSRYLPCNYTFTCDCLVDGTPPNALPRPTSFTNSLLSKLGVIQSSTNDSLDVAVAALRETLSLNMRILGVLEDIRGKLITMNGKDRLATTGRHSSEEPSGSTKWYYGDTAVNNRYKVVGAFVHAFVAAVCCHMESLGVTVRGSRATSMDRYTAVVKEIMAGTNNTRYYEDTQVKRHDIQECLQLLCTDRKYAVPMVTATQISE